MRLKNDIIRLFAAVLLSTSAFAAFGQGWMEVHDDESDQKYDRATDSEEAEELGYLWVDPVKYFKLNTAKADVSSSYDQGTVDFNKVLKKTKKKIYGVRIHPICGAIEIPSIPLTDDQVDDTYTYGNIMGFTGAPIDGAALTINANSGASATYNIKYTMTQPIVDPQSKKKIATWDYDLSVAFAFSGIRMTATDNGVGFAYTLSLSGSIKGHGYGGGVRFNPKFTPTSSSVSGNSTLAHFIYNGGNQLFLILSIPNSAMSYRFNSTGAAYASRPGPRVFFKVEKVMVEDEQEAPAELTEQDKEELINYSKDLVDWLEGRGDELGLGEHTDAKESLVIETIGTILSILLGGGAIGFISGTGGTLTAGFTEIITGGGAPPVMPDIPPTERDPARKKDEEEGGADFTGWEPPKPPNPDDKLFKPSQYPDLCQRYIHEAKDGTLTFTDPITGKRTEYYPDPNGSGGWVKSYGPNEPVYTNEELEERLRFATENYSTLKQDADTAARWQREQHQQWVDQNERDLKRGYSNEMKEYRDWKKAQEQKLNHEIYVDHLALKHNTTVDKLKQTIANKQMADYVESLYQMEISKQYDDIIHKAEIVDKSCEFAVNVMGECVPGGRVVKNAYTFAKSTLVAASEAYNEGMSLEEGLAHVASGAGQGALGVIQNQAGELSKGGLVKEYAITVGTEMVKDGMKVYEKTGDWSTTGYAMINSGAKKTGDFLLGKTISGGINKLKTSATQSLSNKIIPIDKDTGLRMSPENAKKVLTFFNPKGKFTTTGSKGWNIDYKGTNADMNKLGLGDLSKKFSITGGVTGNAPVVSGGSIDPAGLLSTKATEAASKFGLHNWEGQTAEGLVKDATNLGNDLSNFKKALVQRAYEYGKKQNK